MNLQHHHFPPTLLRSLSCSCLRTGVIFTPAQCHVKSPLTADGRGVRPESLGGKMCCTIGEGFQLVKKVTSFGGNLLVFRGCCSEKVPLAAWNDNYRVTELPCLQVSLSSSMQSLSVSLQLAVNWAPKGGWVL